MISYCTQPIEDQHVSDSLRSKDPNKAGRHLSDLLCPFSSIVWCSACVTPKRRGRTWTGTKRRKGEEPGGRQKRGRGTATVQVKKVSHRHKDECKTALIQPSFLQSTKEEEESGIRRLVGWFCGSSSSKVHDQGRPEEPEKMPDISEDPVWKYTVNTNALIMMTVAVFMWGYYA